MAKKKTDKIEFRIGESWNPKSVKLGKKKTEKKEKRTVHEKKVMVLTKGGKLELPIWAKGVDLTDLSKEIIKINQRIDRIIDAHDKCKKLKGI